ncbi:hypothetical protein Tco_0445200 [Tanacetum coccineum]
MGEPGIVLAQVVAKVSLNSSTPRISPDVAALTTEVSELKNMMKTMLIDKQKAQAPAPVKAVEQKDVSQAAAEPFNQGNTNLDLDALQTKFASGRVHPPTSNTSLQAQSLSRLLLSKARCFKDGFEIMSRLLMIVLRNMQNQGQGSLPSNMVTNPKEDLNGITTRSGVAYKGPTLPTSFPRVAERRIEVTKDTIFPTNNEIIQPSVVLVEKQNPVSEPVNALVSAPMPNPKPSIPYPSRRNDERHRENANEQKEKFYEIFKDKSFEISFMDALTLGVRTNRRLPRHRNDVKMVKYEVGKSRKDGKGDSGKLGLLGVLAGKEVRAMAAGISTTYPIAAMAEVIGLAGKGCVVQLFHLTSPPTDTHAATLFDATNLFIDAVYDVWRW